MSSLNSPRSSSRTVSAKYTGSFKLESVEPPIPCSFIYGLTVNKEHTRSSGSASCGGASDRREKHSRSNGRTLGKRIPDFAASPPLAPLVSLGESPFAAAEESEDARRPRDSSPRSVEGSRPHPYPLTRPHLVIRFRIPIEDDRFCKWFAF